MDYRLNFFLILDVSVYLINVYFILVNTIFISLLLFHYRFGPPDFSRDHVALVGPLLGQVTVDGKCFLWGGCPDVKWGDFLGVTCKPHVMLLVV